MKNLFAKFMTVVGGKRGLSVIGSAVVTGLLATGRISPQTATVVGAVAGALGLVGIGHNYGTAAADPASALNVPGVAATAIPAAAPASDSPLPTLIIPGTEISAPAAAAGDAPRTYRTVPSA